MASLELPGLLKAKNCLPVAVGYRPMQSFAPLTSYGALDDYTRGALSTIDRDGVPENFGATGAKLFRIQGGTWTNVSRAGNYTLGAESRWEAAVFSSPATGRRPQVLFTCFDEPVQYYDIGTSALFANITAAVANPGGAGAGAPRARHIAVVGDHVHLAYTYDQTDEKVPNRTWHCALGNGTSWPVPGTDAATSVQSGNTILKGDGGDIVGIVGGRRYGLWLQQRALWRGDYVGGQIPYQYDRIEDAGGMAFPGMYVSAGQLVLYYGDQGFMLFNGTTAKPVGRDVVDEWFAADFAADYAHRVSAVADPARPIMHLGYTGVGHDSAGTPNRILHYNWLHNRFSYSEMAHDYLSLVVNPGPDMNIDLEPGDQPDLQEGTWDELLASKRQLGGFNFAHNLGTLNGEALTAVLETPDLELSPGRFSLLKEGRPLVTRATNVSMYVVGMKNRAQQPDVDVGWSAGAVMDEEGKCSLRKNARYHRLRTEISAGWTGDAIGADLDFVPTSRR